MWIRIRAVIIEDEPVGAQYLTALLDDACQVEVVGSATESEAGLRLCAELRPDAVFVDINLPGKDGVSLAKQLVMLPQPPRLVFTTGNASHATDTFRLEAVHYLLKPLDPSKSRTRSIAYWHTCGPLKPVLPQARAITLTESQPRTKCVLLASQMNCCRSGMWTATGSGCSPFARLQRCCGGSGALGPYRAGRVCHLLSVG